MTRKSSVVLDEIIEAIEGIEAATAGKKLIDFSESWILKHAVQRGLEIISEASRHLPDELLEAAPESRGSRYAASAICFVTNTTRRPTRLSGQSWSTTCQRSGAPRSVFGPS